MKKEENRFRNIPILIRVTSEERKKISNRMKEANFKNMNNYMSLMALNGQVVKIDFESLKESLEETSRYVYELNKIGNNLNQIAHKINQTDMVEKEDIQFLVSEFYKLKKNYINSQEVLLKGIQKIARSE